LLNMAPFVGGGLWGGSWEVDEDCLAVRGVLWLPAPGIRGVWTATARWTAVEPMSEADWQAARANLYLVGSSDLPVVYATPRPR
jgi:hypothetical protein